MPYPRIVAARTIVPHSPAAVTVEGGGSVIVDLAVAAVVIFVVIVIDGRGRALQVQVVAIGLHDVLIEDESVDDPAVAGGVRPRVL